MYEFIETEAGWTICWGPLPVAEKSKGPWERLKKSLRAISEGEKRVRFIQVERPARTAEELMPTRV